MNIQHDKQQHDPWNLVPETPTIGPEAMVRWVEARAGANLEAEDQGWSKALFCKKAEISAPTFTQWYNGRYKGDFDAVTERVLSFLAKREALRHEAVKAPSDPGFVDIPTAKAVFSVFTAAMSLGSMALVTLAAGMGKTMAAREFQRRYPRVAIATMRPTIRTPERAIREVANAWGIDASGYQEMIRQLKGRFGKDKDHSLLIVDEAQFLSDEAVNEIRMLRDNHNTGVVLVGNEEIYGRYTSGDGLAIQAQIRRRISWRLKRMENSPDDIAMILDAWGIQDATMRELAARIARKPGRIGTMVETLKLAHVMAAGHGREIEADDLRAAWLNRSDGGDRL
ncbi:MAG: AAA family ATPase [Rhizobiaceae bacterium]